MMAELVSGMGADGMRGLMYTRPKAIDRYHENVFGGEGGSRYSERFMEKAKGIYNTFRESRLFRSTLASTRKLMNQGKTDKIRQLGTIGEMQHAPRVMEQYVMANPRIRRRYTSNRMAGYENTYATRDKHRNAFRHSHQPYRVVMDGVNQLEGDHMVAHTYHLTDDEKQLLSPEEKGDIRITWTMMDAIVELENDDPTSTYNAHL